MFMKVRTCLKLLRDNQVFKKDCPMETICTGDCEKFDKVQFGFKKSTDSKDWYLLT